MVKINTIMKYFKLFENMKDENLEKIKEYINEILKFEEEN